MLTLVGGVMMNDALAPKAWRSWFNLMSAHVPDDVTPSTPQPTLEDAERHCILHTDNQPPKKPRLHVLPFTDATWNAVQKSASNRKQKKRFLSSKFYGVIQTLPDTPSNADGYHSIC